MIYFIEVEYESFGQGWEWRKKTLLVRNADSFEDACEQIKNSNKFDKICRFNDLTI